MSKYDSVVKYFREHGCELYTTNEEYDTFKNPTKSKVSFKATCGHDNTVTLTNFYSKKTGLVCKNCVYKKISEKAKLQPKESKDYFGQEFEGFKILRDAISYEFDIINTVEGCNADVLIKPKYELADKWMLLQMKTTKQKGHGLYSFSLRAYITYENCEMLFICLDERKIWLLDGNSIMYQNKVNIGLTSRSEYYKYQIDINNLQEILHLKYCTSKRFSSKFGNTPVSLNAQQEQKYNMFLEETMPYLNITYPDIQGSKTDAFINNFRIQFKVASLRHGNYAAFMSSNHRITSFDNIRYVRSYYKKKDNNFYWVWLKNDFVKFYIFPEAVLIERNYILDGDAKTTIRTISITDGNWTDAYKYHVDDAYSKNKLLTLFQM